MLAFGAVVGRRWQYPQWFAAKLRVGFAAGNPFGMRHINKSRDRAATRIASPTLPNNETEITGTVLAASTSQFKQGEMQPS
jgi:hypothetical protein